MNGGGAERPFPYIPACEDVYSDHHENIGYKTWLATREHWRRTPEMAEDPDKLREKVDRTIQDVEYNRIHMDLLTGRKPMRIPLPVLIQALVMSWDE
mmetsp:Transcript_36162/g.101893  ORF Transcript_36162/g.101893 Transcript_36162/m.101893 type:complete len:97 (-) Transcript_36162:195-485(-)|eukprot:CAMPEP_0119132412 /NCGR_PEP_ID=MMETSP1310-20130426/11827_1 /TAXON_ID=464262 /ORGANISM="Genus nov. species nov., Strain RCC2339" /LENGTH=96 /DNA_ID=CAMNT_0007123045 /DNA_START=72 /DNA_END=362 /DNA_ORIENTATION=+